MPPPATTYNPKYFDGTNLRQLRPALSAFRTIKLSDGTLIGLFQGARGVRPDLDFVVKILIPGVDKILTPPTHTYWVVDLLLKIPQYRAEVREIVEYYLAFYDRTTPFTTVAERDAYVLETVGEITERYAHIEQPYTLPLEYVATMIELFSKNEKLYADAYMYRDLLRSIRSYIDGDLHYTEVLKAASPGFRR